MNGWASSSQAVPAISRCTQGVSPANSRRNQAALIAPPQRPPMLREIGEGALEKILVFVVERHLPSLFALGFGGAHDAGEHARRYW